MGIELESQYCEVARGRILCRAAQTLHIAATDKRARPVRPILGLVRDLPNISVVLQRSQPALSPAALSL
jgi:hypothetical protein